MVLSTPAQVEMTLVETVLRLTAILILLLNLRVVITLTAGLIGINPYLAVSTLLFYCTQLNILVCIVLGRIIRLRC